MQQAIVVGCGVSGLTCAIELQAAGFDVSIWARDLPPNTTSNVAAAVWYPYHAYPMERVVPWGKQTFHAFCTLASEPHAGVSLVEGIELFTSPAEEPDWRDAVSSLRLAHTDEIPPGYTAAYLFETPLIDMPIYLTYLMRRFQDAGGRIEKREVKQLAEPLAESRVVVNCAGLGARTLAADDSLMPARGQVVRVEPLPLNRFYLDQSDSGELTYIVPRSADCVLGGTYEEGNWSLEPDIATAEAIVERCSRLAPEVRDARVIEHAVGLRPVRPTVRLEAELQPDGKLLVHNYGHGGAGVTLSWGCAADVLSLVTQDRTT